jgi:hypothetical protein
MSLISIFEEVSDPRRAQGKRTSIGQLFSMVVLSYLCGYVGYRKVSSFSKSYGGLLKEELGLKHPVPSHVTFRDVLQRSNEKELINAFNKWADGYAPMESGTWVSGDGKGLNSTVTNEGNSEQNFQCVVSLFCQKTGLVSMIETHRNKKVSEIEIIIQLINQLKTSGLIIRLDALHSQKKQ